MGHLSKHAALPVPTVSGMLEDAERSRTPSCSPALHGAINVQLPGDWRTEPTSDPLRTCEAPRGAECRSKPLPSINHSDSALVLKAAGPPA